MKYLNVVLSALKEVYSGIIEVFVDLLLIVYLFIWLAFFDDKTDCHTHFEGVIEDV